MLTMHSTPPMVASKLDYIHLHVVEIIFKSYITPIATRKLGYIHLETTSTPYDNKKIGLHPLVCVTKSIWKLHQHPMALRELSWNHLYVGHFNNFYYS
jgi:hypothetical protein